MKFPPDSGGSPSTMGGGGYWDGFLNGDDSFHKVINMLDFPLESVEEDKCVVTENWNAQFQSLGPMTSEILQGFAPMIKSDDLPSNPLQVDATSDRKLLPLTEISSTHVPVNNYSQRANTRLFQTSSPSSVIESSSSCSASKNMSSGLELLIPVRTRTKIPRSSTFTRWHMLSPVTFPREILNSRDKEQMEVKVTHLPNESDIEEKSHHQRMPYKRCTHCQTQKTPQWREGPMGPRTLCNACGVRYRSGRLVPEYRPASSYQTINLPKINGKEKKKKKKIKLSGIPKDNQMKGKLTHEQMRRCSSCQATETPQWREGPMGPKTLCNACGVRYRSESKNSEKINTRRQEKSMGMGWSDPPNEAAADQHTSRKRCAHCQVTKTPQWREGPMGPKTLCNACGVRYRSGRLVPEYRPAASPTFVPTLHSNLHRQVIRMRKQHSEKPIKPEMDPEMSPPPEFVPMSSCYLYDG